MKLLWNNLVLLIIAETLEDSEHINGVRIVDKGNGYFKFEIWVDFDAS